MCVYQIYRCLWNRVHRWEAAQRYIMSVIETIKIHYESIHEWMGTGEEWKQGSQELLCKHRSELWYVCKCVQCMNGWLGGGEEGRKDCILDILIIQNNNRINAGQVMHFMMRNDIECSVIERMNNNGKISRALAVIFRQVYWREMTAVGLLPSSSLKLKQANSVRFNLFIRRLSLKKSSVDPLTYHACPLHIFLFKSPFPSL